MIQWSHETMNHWTNQSLKSIKPVESAESNQNKPNQPINQWTSKTINRKINDLMHQWTT
jgi:hypothetical protein